VVSPITDTLIVDGAISLNTSTTFLNSTEPKDPSDLSVPRIAVLPDGNFIQQRKMILIPAASVNNTAVWRVTGNFVDAVSLKFDQFGQSSELVWDGTKWHVIGNATKEDQ
jgi:hypothetical protein